MSNKSLSDMELVLLLKGCSQGKNSDLEHLYKKMAPILNAYVLRILGCQALSNEVLQDSILQIWEKAGTFDSERGKPLNWIYSIVRNRAIDKIRIENKHIRKRIVENEKRLTELVAKAEYQPENQLSQTQTMDMFNQHLEKLPSNHRLSIYLTYFYGYSGADLAEAMDTNINTIKSWLRRGISDLQQYNKNAKAIN